MKTEIEFTKFKSMKTDDLISFCEKNFIENEETKSKTLYNIMKHYVNMPNTTFIYEGCLDFNQTNNYGFLRDLSNNFVPCSHDLYVHIKFIKEHKLRCGDMIRCEINNPMSKDQKLFVMKKVISINGQENIRHRKVFEELTACYPTEQIFCFDKTLPKDIHITCRFIDLITPIALGQRGLIVAPPKTGKTSILHSVAMAILKQKRKIKLIVVLVGERPEEVTLMKKIAPETEIIFSTFDEPEENQIKMTDIINERAKRMVEAGEDVVILLDSITRLTRSSNYSVPSSGKIMTGGVDPAALIKPKKFFGSARNTEEAGSLTVLATCLIETGSKMDDFIYEELKGTGNAEIKLSRNIAQKRIFPAIEIGPSGARKSELFIPHQQLPRIKILEEFLSNLEDKTEAARMLIEKIKHTETNDELLMKMCRFTN